MGAVIHFPRSKPRLAMSRAEAERIFAKRAAEIDAIAGVLEDEAQRLRARARIARGDDGPPGAA